MNGSAYQPQSTYQPSCSTPANATSGHAVNGDHNGSGSHGALSEGLPRVNDTYAPSAAAYISAAFQETSKSEAPHADTTATHTFLSEIPESEDPEEQVLSTSRDPAPEDATPHGPSQHFSQELSNSVEHALPPSFQDSPSSAQPSWTNHASGSSSPDKTFSPPRSSSTAPHFTSQASSLAYDPYAPPPKSERAQSPGASSIRSVASGHVQGYQPPPRRDSVANTSPVMARPLSSQSRRSTYSSPYETQAVADLKRAASPAGSIASKHSTYDPYSPLIKPNGPSMARDRAMSNGSMYSTSSVDPYAPSRHPTRQSSEHIYGSFAVPTQSAPVPTYDRAGAQVVTLATPVHSSAYAPSPSLLGTNDPLGRTSARVPVISFGFGGKIVTCFHGANMNTGFDVALSSRQSTDIKIHTLGKIIPESVMDVSVTSYPGPLFSDPGTPNATSLVRTGAQAQKAKKLKVAKYLEERADEMAAGLGYHSPGTVERSRAEAKRIMVLLLKVMVDNDGRLSGSDQIDAAVRAALAPSDGITSDSASGSSTMIPATSTEILSNAYSMSSALPNTQNQTVVKTVVRSSHLDKIQDLLARGDRRGACHYAADEKLWSHALLIASSIDKECWKEVVTEWIRAELVSEPGQGETTTVPREPLRVAYSLFGGNGAAAVQELVHPKSLLLQAGSNSNLQIPQPPTTVTPLTPNFPTIQPLNIAPEVLAPWAKTAAMIMSNPMTSESSAALTALGDQMLAHQWTEAAHICYMLSPQTSPLAGLGSTPRLTLLGSPAPTSLPLFYRDSDHIVFSEILEFAMSLAAPTKGMEQFIGFPHLQPYRLIRANNLAELGHVQLANRYCEAITACINRGTPSINITFLEQLKGLSDRLTATPQIERNGAWIGGKLAKPSLDGIGNWLEGRFTKFIAGEGDSPLPEEGKMAKQQQQPYSGPFANYSSISSATTSAYPSPHQSVTDLTEASTPNFAPPFRTGSAMGSARPPSRNHIQINRAASAMDHVRPPFQRGGSPIARVASANAATFADAGPYGQARSPYGNGYAPAPSSHLKAEGSYSHGDVSGGNSSHSKPPSTGSWWGTSESDASTPTATSFVTLDDQPSSSTSASGFLSLIDSPMQSATPRQETSMSRLAHNDDDDDDDLGLGNSSSRTKNAPEKDDTAATNGAPAKVEEKRKSEPEKPDLKQTASGGWLSRIWGGKRDSSSPGPVKANLGEQSSFYYDKELKRWVNNTGGAEAAKSSPPPPPPRAQTASPGRQLGAVPPPSPLTVPPPPQRPATTQPMDPTAEPPRRPPTRMRSNLVPSDVADGTPPMPSSPLPTSGTPPPGAGPPTGSRRGAPGKRNVRSRYVDVFSQEGGGA
ncbi:Sec23-binding domain of Sec16-domain-containing protein [Epithele typhae]|uniref:Sec23-binding domain of Sec16-domain-containing protein n=1 Tax=Epithele typhae TaxID=378194 RepID=UPI002008D828|nr:Sec23-binding domain of Sec16-domain-containing protein [Epithele typhae]KAH9946034.1 Sec23-binding domain of Sec16-domain-containing protein [Epithele typhae]